MFKLQRIVYLLFALGVMGAPCVQACDTLCIVSYNVENLFDNRHDTLRHDLDFTAQGCYHWTYRRFQNKVEHIAQVIVSIGGWEAPVAVGLCEVENERCLRSLCWHLRCYRYKFIHYESPDERGIDVALLYDSTRFHILHSEPIPVPLPATTTRDILYVRAVLPSADTLHTYVCHLPSQAGGVAETAHKRAIAKHILQTHIDSILLAAPAARILVMGDMNSEPADDLCGMHNLMCMANFSLFAAAGTHKYEGIWSYLDQFYVSSSWLARTSFSVFSPPWLLEEDTRFSGMHPRRTFRGRRYQNGYSDHLPVILRFCP